MRASVSRKSGRNCRLPTISGWGWCFVATLFFYVFVSSARGEEDDLTSLELYNGPTVDVVSADRSPRPASQTAENITVITSKDIEALNAHTLADVLFNVTGVQLEMLRTPGSAANIELQGANTNHILVLLDNVQINNLSDNYPDIGSIPVQMIERVEVVKGAASSSWGSALGGVVNIITKVPQTDRPFGGLLSASGGKHGTADGRAELTGTAQGIGYYLMGGKARSDGLLPNNSVDLNSFYGKVHYDLPVHGSVVATGGIISNSAGQLQVPPVNVDQDTTQLIATLSVDYPVTDRLTVDGGFRARRATNEIFLRHIGDDLLLRDAKIDEASTGATIKVSWLDDLQRLVAGVDYDHLTDHLYMPLMSLDLQKNRADRVGVYLNDTFTLGRFAVTPSARWDHTETNGDLFSPSFGITYALTDNTVLRGYTARGYSLTSLNQQNSTEKVWTSQVGFETADLPYVWLKGTLFRNDTWDIAVRNPDGSQVVFKQSQLKQGFEFEARSLPVFYTSLSLGYTFIDARNPDNDAVLKGVARHTLNLGIKYEDSRDWRALLIGHYIDWNADATAVEVKYHSIIWDLFIGKKFRYSTTGSVELFGSVRNIFNGDQYMTLYHNPGTWAEAGVRWAF
jgi:vitamin B12 transporter